MIEGSNGPITPNEVPTASLKFLKIDRTLRQLRGLRENLECPHYTKGSPHCVLENVNLSRSFYVRGVVATSAELLLRYNRQYDVSATYMLRQWRC